MLGYGCGAQCARAYLLLARLSLWSLISLVRLHREKKMRALGALRA
jgi:hypothetical protein